MFNLIQRRRGLGMALLFMLLWYDPRHVFGVVINDNYFQSSGGDPGNVAGTLDAGDADAPRDKFCAAVSERLGVVTTTRQRLDIFVANTTNSNWSGGKRIYTVLNRNAGRKMNQSNCGRWIDPIRT